MVSANDSSWLSLPGAVTILEGPDAGGLAHLGNPLAEQRNLAEGRALVPLSTRAVLTVTGPDRLSWLDSLTSQRVRELPAGVSTELLVLSPTGRIEHAVRVVDDGTTTWMIVDVAEAASLLAFLDSMRFRLRVEVADRSGEYAVIGSTVQLAEVPGVALVLTSDAVVAEWHDPWNTVAEGGQQYALAGDAAAHPGVVWEWYETVISHETEQWLATAAGCEAIVAEVEHEGEPQTEADATVKIASASADEASALPGDSLVHDIKVAGIPAAEALRVAVWRPRLVCEGDERSIPHELDWLRSAVHLNKGCYRGQETVAKVHNLGHPPRLLTLLHLDGSDAVLPRHGDVVFAAVAGGQSLAIDESGNDGGGELLDLSQGHQDSPADRPVGFLTTVVMHYEFGPLALAVLTRRAPTDTALVVDSQGVRIAATPEVIVPATAGGEHRANPASFRTPLRLSRA